MKLGDRVCDRWWPWRVGTLIRVGKWSVRVRFPDVDVTYDRAHRKFLMKINM